MKILTLIPALVLLIFSSQAFAVILYDQDFENPAAFVNNGGDVNISNPVNSLYGNQPPGFLFAQAFTVETLLVTGNQAFGTGYSDPSGIGGNYTLGMLSNAQNDLLGLSFDVGVNDFLNVRMDISSIDLSVFGGPFVPAAGIVPTFQFTLYDNPGGGAGLFGNGTVLSQLQASGTASPRDVFDWTEAVLPLSAVGNTNGNVILQIDMLNGGYGALDNFLIEASETPGNPAAVPVPAAVWLFGTALLGLAGFGKRKKRPS